MTIRFTILGQPCSKSNRRQLVKFGNRPALIKSADALEYERSAMLQIPSEAKQMLQGELRMTLHIFYASEQPDLDESIILDVLQAKFETVTDRYEKIGPGQFKTLTKRVCVRKGVYLNDRQVRERHVYHGIDKLNPRAEIEVEQIVPELFSEVA